MAEEGGYDYEFVDTPLDNLVCKICHYPSREPHLTVCCGHTFCKSCLENARSSTAISNACPVCRREEFTTVPNKQNERDILSLHVSCTNSEKGCNWIGELNDVTDHLKNNSGCKFEEVHCTVGCGKTLERQYLTGHVEKECPCRLISCEYCGTAGEYQFIEGSHKQNCLEYPIPCANNCEIENFPRKLLEEHRKVCPLEIVQCEYHSVGCDTKMPRKDLTKHDEEKTNEHLSLMKSALVDTQNKLSDTQRKLSDTQDKLSDTEQQLTLKLDHNYATVLSIQQTLADTQNTLSDTQDRLSSTEEQLALKTASNCAEVLAMQKKLSKTQNKLSNTKKQLTSKLQLNAEALATQATEYSNLESNLAETESNFQDKIDSVYDSINEKEDDLQDEITSVRAEITELKATLQQKTKLIDMIFGEWAIILQTRAAKLSSCNQHLPVIIKLPYFVKNKNDKVDWYSNPFLRSHCGHKMKLNVVPAGYGTSEGSYMSVYLYIMSGPHDYQLTWPLKGKFQVTLLNQICDSGHHSVSYQNRAKMNQSTPFWYCEEFISYEVLREISTTRQFIKDDCLFFKVDELESWT